MLSNVSVRYASAQLRSARTHNADSPSETVVRERAVGLALGGVLVQCQPRIKGKHATYPVAANVTRVRLDRTAYRRVMNMLVRRVNVPRVSADMRCLRLEGDTRVRAGALLAQIQASSERDHREQ